MHREIEEELKRLLALYFENFAGAVAPAESSAAFHLRTVLKETTYANLEPLVISVAKDGMVLTRNSLLIARNKKTAPPQKPTPTPPPYQDPDYHGAVPMPAYVREELNRALRRKYE